jgi:osmotically-inducible protein OsmY
MARIPYAAWRYPIDRYYYPWYDEELAAATPPGDGEIKSIVVDRLRENPYTEGHELRVDVKDGVVILLGEVSSARAKRAAGDDAWDTPGVTDVSNQLTVAETS